MFHFTIRDLLWLTAAVAVSAFWVADHQTMTERLSKSHRDKLELEYRLNELSTMMFSFADPANNNYLLSSTPQNVRCNTASARC